MGEDLVRRLRAAGCVYAEDEARLLVDSAGAAEVATEQERAVLLERLVAARIGGAPLEHLLGWAAFGDRGIAVRPGVFVPRARSLLLVREAARRLTAGRIVVDLCCGTGAIGAAVLDAVPGVEVHAADVEADAVACARENLAAAGGDPSRVHHGDLYAPLPPALRGRISVLVVNAPYVPTAEIAFMPGEARDHEALVALDGGPDGSAVHRRVIEGAPAWVADGGHLLIETGRRQAEQVAGLMTAAGATVHVAADDDLDATAVIGTFSGAS